MTTFASYDGTVLAYRQLGEGQRLVCLFPWLDDPIRFTATLAPFLTRP